MSAGAAVPVILTENLTRTYKMGSAEVQAVRSVDLTVRRGEFVALMGASGSGKSTLMHLLGCLDTPDAGRYWLDGEDVSGLSPRARASARNRHIGFIFQNFNLLPRLTALENVMLPLMYSNRSETPRVAGTFVPPRDRAADSLARVGLAKRAGHRPNELSGGERQRVAIARALVTTPALLLADEPTGNIDTRTGKAIMALIGELHAEGRTVLMVTHDTAIAGHGERILEMQDGQIRERGLKGEALPEMQDGQLQADR